MRPFPFPLAGLVFLLASLAFADDRIAPEPKPAPPQVQPPILPPQPQPQPPIVQPRVAEWTLSVQADSLQGEKSWGQASIPASSNGLRVTLWPEQASFPANGPLSFRVELENTTDAPLVLADAARLGGTPKLVFAHQKTAAQWSLEAEKPKAEKPANEQATVTIPAGDSVAYTIVVQVEGAIVRPQPQPQPVPLPLPLPVPLPAQPEPRPKAVREEAAAEPEKDQPQEEVEQEERGQALVRRPFVRPAPVVWAQVPVGQGPVRAQLFLDFPKAGKTTWSGRLASKPVDLTIDAARAVPVPLPAVREKGVE